MQDNSFYIDLKETMIEHDLLYNKFTNIKYDSPLLNEHFNILYYNIIAYTNNKEELSVNQLANYVTILPTNLSPILNILEKKNWIERFRKEDDKRFVYVRMSPEGKRKIDIHRKKTNESLSLILNKALTSEEQQDLFEIYHKLVNYFKKIVEANYIDETID